MVVQYMNVKKTCSVPSENNLLVDTEYSVTKIDSLYLNFQDAESMDILADIVQNTVEHPLEEIALRPVEAIDALEYPELFELINN